MSALRKSYVLVSSSDRVAGSRSTTDFQVRLPVPVHKVIKCDLVQFVMDYRVANVTAPNNTLSIQEGLVAGTGDLSGTLVQITRDLTLEEGLFTPSVLVLTLKDVLGNGYSVTLGSDGIITIKYLV